MLTSRELSVRAAPQTSVTPPAYQMGQKLRVVRAADARFAFNQTHIRADTSTDHELLHADRPRHAAEV